MINQGELLPLFARPIAGTLYVAAVIGLAVPSLLAWRRRSGAATAARMAVSR